MKMCLWRSGIWIVGVSVVALWLRTTGDNVILPNRIPGPVLWIPALCIELMPNMPFSRPLDNGWSRVTTSSIILKMSRRAGGIEARKRMLMGISSHCRWSEWNGV